MTIWRTMSYLGRRAVFLVLISTLPIEAAPADTPESFVRSVYARYRAHGPGVPMSRPGGDAFYTSALLDLFAKDQAGAQGEGAAIDWDPVCSCQDYDLRLKAVRVDQGNADAVKAQVSFSNLGSNQTVVLTLSHTQGGWRIADVGDKDVKSVVALLDDSSKPPAK